MLHHAPTQHDESLLRTHAQQLGYNLPADAPVSVVYAVIQCRPQSILEVAQIVYDCSLGRQVAAELGARPASEAAPFSPRTARHSKRVRVG